MQILVSKELDVEGYTLLWDARKCNHLLGIERNLFIKNGWLPLKTEKDMKMALIRNRDVRVTKLREKLFSETSDIRVWAIIEALGQPGATVENFTYALMNGIYSSSTAYEEDTKESIKDGEGEVEEEKEEEVIENTLSDDKEDVWSSNLFSTYGEEKETVDLGYKEEEEFENIKKEGNDYLSSLVVGNSNEDVKYTEESSSDIDTRSVTSRNPTNTNSQNELSLSEILECLKSLEERICENKDLTSKLLDKSLDVSSKTESIESLIKNCKDLTIELKEGKITNHNIEYISKELKKSIFEHLKLTKSNEKIFGKKFSKRISGDERIVIDNYMPNPQLIRYLQSDKAFGRQSELVEVDGLEMISGVSDVMYEGTEGFFEFIAKYYPFIYLEYKNEILGKIKKSEEVSQ